ncbi:MAG: flagellar motor switch protein FliG, partial [bacterium]
MSPKRSKKSLSGLEKAAILMVAVGTEGSASILQNLSEDEIETVTKEIV